MNKDRIWHLVSKQLAGEVTEEEIHELEGLLRSDPDMHYALQNITDIWKLQPAAVSESDESFDRHVLRMKQAGLGFGQPIPEPVEASYPFPEKKKHKKWLIAASITGCLLLATFLWFNNQHQPTSSTPLAANKTPEVNEISTHNGSKTKVVLPDGSKVWLNSGSHLTYNKNFGTDHREVLLSGEAYFDVVKDTEHPFVIHTKKIDIRVLGTAFNVKSYPGDKQTETSLVRGKVEIRIHNRPDEKIVLNPNEKLVVLNNENQLKESETKPAGIVSADPIVSLSRITTRPSDNVVVETAWVDNKLVFNNETFREVATKMERWYNVEFEFKDTANIHARFTGIFENETIGQALAALRITGDFNYAIKANKVIITDK